MVSQPSCLDLSMQRLRQSEPASGAPRSLPSFSTVIFDGGLIDERIFFTQ